MALFSGWTDFPLTEPMMDSTLKAVVREGLHLGDVLKAIMASEGESYVDDAYTRERFLLGYVWETALEYMLGGFGLDAALDLAFKRYMVALRTGVTKQVALEKDGIKMTPDAFNAATGEIESYKSTARSLARAATQDGFESDFRFWLMGDAAYCWAAGVDTARYIVLWRAGDYSKMGGSPPRVMQATVTWTAEELRANWERVLRVAEGLR